MYAAPSQLYTLGSKQIVSTLNTNTICINFYKADCVNQNPHSN
uniref:Uncharacterized protein n=1 Tax=Arundo donax TaxID=35708 RepID=A0A0A9AIE5_ARUDO